MLGFESGSYFICTETSPRCFVLQQMSGPTHDDSNYHIPPSPQQPSQNVLPTQPQKNSQPPSLPQQSQSQSQMLMLPWWFTAECRQQLLSVPSFEALARQHTGGVYASISRSATPEQMTMEQLRSRLKRQLEYYFSRENLINDRYLRCQMDADQYVSIKIVAGFPKVAQLTNDFDLIVDVLRSSINVQVDDAGKKVRPVMKRCTIILRDIPESATENDVKTMFDGCAHKFVSIAYGLNNSWYVTFEDEEATKLAFLHLKDLAFNDKPIHARIKTGNAPGHPQTANSQTEFGHFAPTCVTPVPPAEKGDVITSTSIGQLIVHDISHHYHNLSLHNHVVQQQQQNGRYLPIEIDTSLPSIITTTTYSGGGLSPNGFGGRRLSPTQTGVGPPTDAPSSLNLGLLLAQYGYVPRATFRPNVPPPSVAVSEPPMLSNASTVTPPVPPPPTKSKAADDDKENKLLLNTERKRRLISEGSQLSAYSLKTTAAHSDPGIRAASPPDFGRQRITDVPRLNRDRCSPLMHGGRPTAGFLAGMSLVANGMLARAAAGGRAIIDGPPLAFTDGTHLSAIIDPSALLNGPQIIGDVVTVYVDERPVIDQVADKINSVSTEKAKSLVSRREVSRRSSLPHRNTGKNDSAITRTPLLATFELTNRPARVLRNRFSESDGNYRTPKTYFNKANNKFTNNSLSFSEKFNNNNSNEGTNRIFYSNHAPRLAASASFDATTRSSAANPLCSSGGALQPLSTVEAEQRRLKFSSNHYTYRNTAEPPQLRHSAKRVSLISHDEQRTFANTAANTVANRGMANDSVSFDAADGSSGFNLMDAEFPKLANDKRCGESAPDEPSCNKKNASNDAQTADGDTNGEHRRGSARVQFSAVVAGVHPNADDANHSEYSNYNTYGKQQVKTMDDSNNNSSNNLLTEKCSYAQTLKKVHR